MVARRFGVNTTIQAFIASIAALVVPAQGLAAELGVTAPDDCALEATLREDAERLTGAPISDVPGMDFEIEIDHARDWTLRLVSIERGTGTKRVRELRGASCAEVTNAGAVALALAIQQATPEREEPLPSAEAPASAPGSLDVPEVKSAPEPQADRALSDSGTSVEPAPASLALGAGFVVDSNVLPALAPGAGVELAVRYRGWRGSVVGTWLAPQHVAIDAERGGDFQLLAVGLLACREAAPALLTPLACAGYELGSLQGEGTGVTHSKLGAVLWQAARLEAGVTARFGSWGADGRAGIAVPFERQEFVLDGTDLVHRPDGLSGRLYLGLNSTF